MYLAPGDIRSVLTWFNRRGNPNKFLCLLVAGHLRDLWFFQDVIEQRLALTPIAGHNITILLLANEVTSALTLIMSGGRGKVVPGQNLGTQRIRGLSTVQSIADLPLLAPEVRETLITTSQTMAFQIGEHFTLEVEDMPCILFLSKGNTEPCMIPTRGEANVQTFYSFLRDVRKIADTLPADGELEEPLKKAKVLVERHQLARAVEIVQQASGEFEEANAACITVLARFPIPPEGIRALFGDERNIQELVGLLSRPPHSEKVLSSQPGFQQAYEDAEFRKRCQTLGHVLKKRKKAEERLEKYQAQAKQYLRWSEQADIRSIAEEINRVCKKYEEAFPYRAGLRPIREVLEGVLVGGKTVHDLMSLDQTIRKLIGT